MSASPPAFDYVIVGAGSAGCVLANRLSEDRHVSVLLLEAGGWDRDPWIHIPIGWGRLMAQQRHDWRFSTEPEPHAAGRRLECPRGKVIGGSSSINALGYVRGHPSDYDRWAALGLPEWSYARVLPYFKRQESWEGGASAFRGGNGPIGTRFSRFVDPLVDALMEAGRALGYPATEDYNGAHQEGFARTQVTIREGRRASSASAYLRPALRRGNLRVEVHAHATRVLLEGTRAAGLEYVQRGLRRSVRATREVLLCGGVIHSPQLLMLSGIGDPAELAKFGIATRVALPGVGRNLQDHPAVRVVYERKSPGPFLRGMRVDRIGSACMRAHLFGTGPATELPGGHLAFLRSVHARSVPDLQYLYNAAPLNAVPYLQPFRKPYDDAFVMPVVLLRPQSRGKIGLASKDPLTAPRIWLNVLAADADLALLLEGIGKMREVVGEKAMQPFAGRELGTDGVPLEDYVRATLGTTRHPAGTCRMGADDDPLTVLDSTLRVRGIDALRVVDAAAMPDLVGGNLNATVLMIAEKAADMIRGHAAPAPEPVPAEQGQTSRQEA